MTLPVDVSFAKSCGQVSPISLKVTSVKGDKTAKIVVNKPFAFIGSNLHCDINLPNPAVSHRHVYLQLIGGRLYCIDQASREGIFWGDRQRLFGWLDVGQSLRVGPYELILAERIGAEDCSSRADNNQAPIFVEPENAALPQGSMQITDTLTLPLRRQLTIIGRSKYCHLELDHEDVSRVHASLLRTHDGKHWIIDLMSRTGVKVNGIRCQVSPLKDGDVVKIGNYATTFKLKSPASSEVPTQPVTEFSAPPSEPSAVTQAPPALMEIEAAKQEEVEAPAALGSIPFSSLFAASVQETAPPPEAVSVEPPSEPLTPEPPKQGELVALNSGPLVPVREGKLRKRKRRPVRAQLAHSSGEMQLVTNILQQMQQMQQEMFSQVRMSMQMISDYVEKMQANQRESVRTELSELQQLTQELLTLKEQLHRPMPSVRSMVSQSSALSKMGRREPVRVAPVARRLRSELPPSPAMAPSEVAERQRTEAAAAEVLGLQPDPPPVTERESVIEPAGAHSHTWITQRVASLEKERQSRWQRILAKITGR
jgi:pSer/pThr/pTyr-binding forkhead associated (FHA) protein